MVQGALFFLWFCFLCMFVWIVFHAQQFWHQIFGDLFPHTKQFFETSECPTVQFNSDTNHLELMSDSIDLKAQSHKIASISEANCKQQDSRLSTLLWVIGNSSDAPLSLNDLPEWLTELGKTFYLLLPDYYKGYNCRLQTEEVGKARCLGCVLFLLLSLEVKDKANSSNPLIH